MNNAAWQVWIMQLPSDPLELEQVKTELQREVKRAEDRLADVLATGGNSRAHRETLIALAELNSKLRVIEARKVDSIPA